MTIIINPNELDDKKNVRKGQPVRPNRSVKVNYRNALYDITRMLGKNTQEITSLYASGAPAVQVIDQLNDAIARSQARADAEAERIAEQFLDDANIQNKQRFENMLKQSLGVDYLSTISGENTAIALQVARAANVGLIKSIASEHWSKVLLAVNQNLSGTLDMPLTSRLKQIGGITTKRAQLIARDQTSKITSQLNQARQFDAGIKSYTWRTAEDERVVGTPGGLYPKGNKAHRNHYKRNGEKFYWKSPPSDGHPGEAINCRCIAIPIIEISELNTL